MSLAETLLSGWRESPSLFWRGVTDSDVLRREQETVLDSLADPASPRISLVASRGWGKSRTVAAAALWYLSTRPGSLVIIAAPSERQVLSTFVELRSLFNRSKLRSLFPAWQVLNTSVLTDRPEWRIVGMSSDNPGLLEGLHAETGVLLIVDEAKNMPDEYFSSLVGSLAAAAEAKIFVCGTGGSPAGFFFRSFGSERGSWKTFRFSASDSPHVQEIADAERRRLGADDPTYLAQYEGRFTSASDWGMFSLDSIQAAIGRDPDQESENLGVWVARPRTFGVDIARTHDDTVICRLRGRRVEGFDVLPRGDEMQTAGHIIAAARSWRAREIVIDEGGLGHGVKARVGEIFDAEVFVHSPQNTVTVSGLNSSWSATDSARFANRKTELLCGLRKMLLDGEIGLPDSERLVAEMLGVKLSMGSSGRLKTTDPRKSPDFLDSLLCALHARDGGGETVFVAAHEAITRGLI